MVYWLCALADPGRNRLCKNNVAPFMVHRYSTVANKNPV
jgi:hypothetical protein